MLKDAYVPKKYVIISAILVIILTIGVKTENSFMLFFDQLFSSVVQNEHLMFLQPIMHLITMIADTKLGLIYAVFIAGILWISKQRVDAIWVICTMFGGAVVAFILKEVVQRARPTVNQIIPETGFSMPSGHTFEAFLILAFIYLYFVRHLKSLSAQKWGWRIIVICQILVMWSRIYMGAHYLTDTVVAVTLGTFWLWVALLFYQKFYDMIDSWFSPVNGGRHQRRY